MKISPIMFSTPMVQAILNGKKSQARRLAKQNSGGFFVKKYSVGDSLWVKESWREVPSKVTYDSRIDEYVPIPRFEYKADNEESCLGSWTGSWKVPMFMPASAARLFLRVVDVQMERLQDITEEDAIAEGFERTDDADNSFFTAKDAFRDFWDSLNANRGYGWEINPWVWVCKFEREDGLNHEEA